MIHPRVQEVITSQNKSYQIYKHKDYGEIGSPKDFAEALKTDLNRISKTLFLRTENASQEFALVVCPIPSKLNIPVVSEKLGCRRAELGKADDLARVLGYPSHGVSPLGAGELPVLIDEQLFKFPNILIGSGVLGEEIELSPEELLALTKGQRGIFC